MITFWWHVFDIKQPIKKGAPPVFHIQNENITNFLVFSIDKNIKQANLLKFHKPICVLQLR